MLKGALLWALTAVGVAAAVAFVPEMYGTWAGLLAVLVLMMVLAALAQRQRAARDAAALQARVDALGSTLAPGALRVPLDPALARVAETLEAAVAGVRKEAAKAQRQAELQQAIFDGMPEGVVALDPLGRVAAINPAAAATLGIDAADAVGRGLVELTADPPMRALALEALSAGGPGGGDDQDQTPVEERHASIEVRVGGAASGPDAAADDSRAPGRVFKARGSGVRTASGEELGAVIVLSDITRLRRLETVRRDFVAHVSHELKTPITAILGFAESLQEEGAGPGEQAQRHLGIITRHALRLERMVDELLLLARVEEEDGERAVPPPPARLEPIVQEVRVGCAALLEDYGATLEVDCPPELSMRAKPALITHAVSNLVHNAIRHGGPSARVELTVRQDADEVVVAVRDHGPGVAAEQRERIFERFFQGQPSGTGKEGGTGLGLAIVRRIARAQGGSVAVEDAPGGGALFSLRLPGLRRARTTPPVELG